MTVASASAVFVVVVFSVVVEFVVVLLFAVACSLVVNPLLDVSFVVDDNKFSAIYPFVPFTSTYDLSLIHL